MAVKKVEKIGFSGGLKFHGNVNRILEMAGNGIGDNAISGHFKDNGIEMSPQFVREIRLGAVEASKKALPKQVAAAAIETLKQDNDKYNAGEYGASGLGKA